MPAPAHRLSDATRHLGIESSFEVLAQARALEAMGREIVHLEIGEPNFDTPSHIKEAALRALEADHTHYTPSTGLPALRAVIAEYAARFRGIPPFTPEHVLVGPGCKPLVWNILSAVLEPGDEMLYASPAYPAYACAAGYLGATPVPIPLLESSNFRIDLERFAAAVTSRTKLVVLNSPHNPTGGVLTREDIEEIAEIVIANDLLVLSDEIYCRNVYDGAFVSIASIDGMRERAIIVDGFSKAYAMTGWRLGYAVMPVELVRATNLFNNNTFSCATTFVQYAGIAALQGPDEPIQAMSDELHRRRDVLIAGLNAIPGISCVLSHGAFYAFPNVQALTDDDQHFARFLLDQGGVAVLGGSSFGVEGAGHLRVSYASSMAEIEAGLTRLAKAVPEYRPAS
jgi:aspartate aminotransferase